MLYLQKILENIDNAIADKGSKLILISGHDDSLTNLLAAFDIMTVECVTDKFLKTPGSEERYCVTQFPPVLSTILIEL